MVRVIDLNTKLGHWPYRPVKKLDALVRAMDECGVEKSVVSSLNAVFYLNPQDGNEEVRRCIEPHDDRFIPFAVLKPTFAKWEEDLDSCLDEHEMRGVVLYPNYHRFELADPRLAPLMARAAERRIPVCVQAGLEDPRRQYEREIVPEVPSADIGAFARAYPDVTVVALGLKINQPRAARQDDSLPDNFLFDISNYETMGEIEAAVDEFGPDRMLYGSNFPLFNPRANALKLAKANISEDARAAIAGGNARRLLGL